MASRPLSPEGPPPGILDVLRRLHRLGFCRNIDAPAAAGNVSVLFDQILRVFMVEYDRRDVIPPLPAVLGNGTPVDLFELYRAVAKLGGFDAISAAASWAAVAAELGLGPEFASSLKLFHFKYLGALNPLLRKVLGGDAESLRESLSSSVCDSNAETSGSCRGTEKDSEPPVMSGSNEGGFLTQEKVPKSKGGDGVSCSSGSDVMVVDPPAVGDVQCSPRKRKSDAMMAVLLEWVLRLAKNPCDPSVGWVSSDKAKDKDREVPELMSEVLVFRKLIFSKVTQTKDGRSISEDPMRCHQSTLILRLAMLILLVWFRPVGVMLSFLKKQKMHPSIYEDNLDTSVDRKLRCSKLIPGKDTDLMSAVSAGKRKLRSCSLLADVASDLLYKAPLQKRIPLGPSFQAEVPECMSATSGDSDDMKWLGTQIWPLGKARSRTLSERAHTGKGREDKCACQHPGSVECVRYHVAEKRHHLKSELGSAFHDWGFNDMGEEVALSWSEEEERRFKAIVRLNPPSLDKNFWDQLCLSFPSKGRQKLVSYYFNVFLLRRRGYQNRTTPDTVDSDDEERDYGFLSRPFVHDAVKAQDCQTTFCAPSMNFVDLTHSSDPDAD